MTWCRWCLLALLNCCWLQTGNATMVDPRSGAVGSALFLRPIYVPSPRTEAPTNPRPGHYEVTEPTLEGDFTTRTLPRVYYDPRVTRRPPVKSFTSHEAAAAAPQWQLSSSSFAGRDGSGLRQNALEASGQQEQGQHRVLGQQEQGRGDSDSYRRGYNKKGFRNYENRENWGRRKEQHYGLDDPRLRAGYEEFMRFFGDFATGKGSYGDLGVNGRSGALLGHGLGMAMRHGAYGMPLYAPTYDLDYTNYIALR